MTQYQEPCLASASECTQENKIYLTKVTYNEPKAEMLAEFSNGKERIVQRHKFFPYMNIATGVGKEKLAELILSLGFRGFNVNEKEKFLSVQAANFSELKKISNALSIHINKKPIVLEPERTFLLEKGWNYFGEFEKQGANLFPKKENETNTFRTAQKELGFFLTPLVPFEEALKVSEEDALHIVDRAAWSETLLLPMDKIPEKKEERAEIFLENVFFKNGEMLQFEQGAKIYSQKDFEPYSKDSTSKIDFSLVWTELFTNNFFNIGPETKNCECCRPIELNARNLLPSSLIKVRFNSDNVFFESSSDSYSMDYHNSRPFKEDRASKKREFFLNSYPIGPFFKDDSALVPLNDAKKLFEEGKAKIDENQLPQGEKSPHELNWFCQNQESFFSKEVRMANLKMFLLAKEIAENEKELFFKNKFGHYYSKALYGAIGNLLSQIPTQLTSPNSKFFSTKLARSIVSVQEATISKFREFSEKNGYRVLQAGSAFATVKGFSSLKLAKNFSEQTKLPQPQIASFTSREKTRTYRKRNF